MIDSLAIFGAEYLVFIILGFAFTWLLIQPNDRKKELLAYGIIALPVTYGLLKLAALLYYDPRPFVLGHFIPIVPHNADNGFPSDHTILAAAIASMIFPYNKKLAMTLWIFTGLIGASRVYVGIHHSIDIIASMIIAILVAYVIHVYALPIIIKSKWYSGDFKLNE